MEELTRGELAREGRVNIETIRYYERRGLLPKPKRTPSGYRIFSFDDVRRVRFIKRAQELGDAADKAANLMGCKSPAVNCPIQTASISDVEQGNELYGARK
jgi:MerR family transcriptional regulator, mercuric resistance operon regulatory protein